MEHNLKILKNENAERIIKAVIPEEILKLKPIIAGGFIVSLYNNVIRHTGPKFDIDMNRKLNLALNSSIIPRSSQTVERLDKIIDKFGDIDFWFVDGNPIWDDFRTENALIKDYYPDQYIGRENKESTWGVTLEPLQRERTFYEASKLLTSVNIYGPGHVLADFSYSSHFEISKVLSKESIAGKYELEANLKNSTYWANSFVLRDTGYSAQFIKKPFSGPDSLFENFDILNCCAAYYNGNFCFHDEFEQLYDDGILKSNLDFEEIGILRKIWVTSRSFKYKNRYNVEPDYDFCNGIFKTYMEAADLQKKIEDGDYKPGDTIQLDRYGTEDPYGRTEAPIRKIKFMLRNILDNFEDFTKFKNYDDVYNAYFITLDIPEIKSVMKKSMYPDQKESDKDKKSSVLF
jgi:hypothetical protein